VLHPLPIPLDLMILITLGEEYKSWSSSLCSFLRPHIASFLFRPNILLSTPFSNIFSLCSSLNARDEVSQVCRTMVLYILIFTFLDSKRVDRRFWTEQYCLKYDSFLQCLSISSSWWLLIQNNYSSKTNLFLYKYICIRDEYQSAVESVYSH
jgi:hypothetical protein